MKILAISKELQEIDWDDCKKILQDEAGTLHDLYLSGQVREFYFTDGGDAVLILECDSTDDARVILGKLPLVVHGLIGFEVMELNPYSGFSRLFYLPPKNPDS